MSNENACRNRDESSHKHVGLREFPGKLIGSVLPVRSFFALWVVRFDIVLGRASGDKEHGEGDGQTP
jgi:hypothetical protein